MSTTGAYMLSVRCDGLHGAMPAPEGLFAAPTRGDCLALAAAAGWIIPRDRRKPGGDRCPACASGGLVRLPWSRDP